MKNKVMFLTLMVAMISSSSFAAILTVSPNPGSAQYTTIQAAHNASAAGDTIVVGPGSYTWLNITHKVHVIGAGWDQCTINGSTYGILLSSSATGSAIEGIRLQQPNTWGVYIYSPTDSITIRRCMIESGGVCIGIETARLTVEDCVLHSLTNGDIIYYAIPNASGVGVFRNTVFSHATPAGYSQSFEGTHGNVIEIYNCVFLNQYSPFYLLGTAQVVGINNIFWDWVSSTSYGTLPAGSVFEYSAAGGSPPAFPAGFSNNISLDANNPFTNYNNTNNYEIGITNLHLAGTGGTQCTDTGYPSIFDLNASRSDLGIYGGPKPLVDNGIPSYPFALTLTIDNLVEVGDSVSTSSTGRIGPRY